MANILALTDFHCGSGTGWTPEGFLRRSPILKEQRKVRRWLFKELGMFPKFDRIVFAGDAIDGAAYKDRSCGLLTADLDEQVEMAIETFKEFREYGKRDCKIAGVTGTPYHADIHGKSAEEIIAKRMGWDKVGHRLMLNVDGCRIDIRHKTSKTGNLHTGANALQKEMLNNLAKAKDHGRKRPDLMLRGHIHESMELRTPELGVGVSLPALQMEGSKYGKQQCDGWVHFGFHVFKTKGSDIIESHPRWIDIQPTAVQETAF
jgi:hypothetical protein